MNPPREIGPFEILELLGAGGMGEVFRARDKRLNRFAAIKFLPEAASPSARERFQREAQAIAALNHPHICTLYEVGEDHSRPYLVMELLEGETLHARLQRGPVNPAQLVQWGGEIADALQAAHAKGILHRDLKPVNIFVTQRGSVKVLDFGLAQFAVPSSVDDEADTIAGSQLGAAALPPLTTPGTTLGTWAYMSPEQARGEPTDARSDIFSLGVMLYEMAGGRRPFQGRTTADLSAAILTFTPPPPSSLRPSGSGDVPPRLDDIIAQCLEKDPGLRFQSATELRVSLRRLGAAPSSSSGASAWAPATAAAPAASTHISSPTSGVSAPQGAPATAPRGRHWLWPVVAAAIIVVAALGWWRLLPRSPSAVEGPAAPVQLHFRQLTFTGHVQDAVISPDGKFLAHVDNGPQGTSLHLLSIASGSDVEIVAPGNGCCASPSFSPDGSEVYFLKDRVLKSVPVLGGAVRIIVAHACSGAGFSPDGSQITFVSLAAVSKVPRGQQLMLARPDGTGSHLLSAANYGDNFASQCTGKPGDQSHPPAWSPDGRWIAVTRFLGHGFQMWAVNAQDGETLAVPVGSGRAVSWLPGGKSLVTAVAASPSAVPQVWRIAFPGGAATQLTTDLQGYTLASASNDGELALIHGAPQYSVWTQAKVGGAFVQLPGGGGTQDGAAGLAWTPTGGLISTHVVGGADQIWSENADGSGGRLLTQGSFPAVAPNGQIVFSATGDLWRIAPDGTGLTALNHHAGSTPPVLADGGRDVVYLLHSLTNQTLRSVPLAGGTPRQIWSHHVFGDGLGASPGGKRIFAIAQGATADAHVPVLITLNGGDAQITPLAMDFFAMDAPYGWTPDGRAITYVKNQGSVDNIWAFPLAGGKPYAITHFADLRIAAYAFSKDGRLAISRGTPNSDAVLATGLVKKP